MSYLDGIPHELWVIIASYFDYDTIVKNKESLSGTDYFTLIGINFRKVFELNPKCLITLNCEAVYLSLLRINRDIFSMNEIYKLVKDRNNKDLLKYLIECYLVDDEIKVRIVIMIDDLELYRKIPKKKDVKIRSERFYYMIIYGAINILKYSLKRSVPKYIKSLVLEALENHNINMEIIELLMDLTIYDELDILGILYSNNLTKEAYDYILAILDEYAVTGEDFYQILSLDNIPKYKNFYPLWIKYNHLLNKKQINDVYVRLILSIGECIHLDGTCDESVKVLTTIANHPIIKKIYIQ